MALESEATLIMIHFTDFITFITREQSWAKELYRQKASPKPKMEEKLC